MLSVARHRFVIPGQRVRIHSKSDRLNGLIGTVTSVSSETAWVRLDPVDPDDLHPEEIRFYDGELEKIQEAEEMDPDAPEPYAAVLDYITPLKGLGFKLLAGESSAPSWRKTYDGSRGYPWHGALRMDVVPQGLAANIIVTYRFRDGPEHIFNNASPAIDVMDRVREIELAIKDSMSLNGFIKRLEQFDWPGSRVTSPDRIYRLFGESLPDNPDEDTQRLFNQLQDDARVVNAFVENTGLILRRRPKGERRAYELTSGWRTPDDDIQYIVFLEKLADGSWAVSAIGTKFFDREDGNRVWQDFEIQQAWDIPANVNDDELAAYATDVWIQLQRHRGPDEYEPDLFGESVDDINFDAYAKEAAGYNPVQLLTAKEIRAWIREAGYKVSTVYKSKRTTGWNFTAIPGSTEVFNAFRNSPDEEKYRVHELIRQKLVQRFPSYTEFELLQHLYLHVWNWSGDTSAEPDNPRNYVLYVDIQPTDADRRKNGLLVKEAIDEIEKLDDFDTERYAKTTIEPLAFLEAAGWVKDDKRNIAAAGGGYKKIVPLPMSYVMGQMTFTKIKIVVYILDESDRSAHVAIYFVNDNEQGLPIGFGWTLISQKRFACDSSDAALDTFRGKIFDESMPLRKFVIGIVPLLSTIKWPDKPHSTLVAASHVEDAVSKFVGDINETCTKPLGPAPQQESFDPDAPEGYVKSLGTIPHVAARFGMRQKMDVGHSKEFVRDVPFHYPMSIRYQGKEYTSQAARVFLFWSIEPQPTMRVSVWLVLDGGGVYRLWDDEQRYKSEAAAALHLNEALNYLFQSLDDRVEGHNQRMLRDIIGMGVTPFLRRAADEDEDPE